MSSIVCTSFQFVLLTDVINPNLKTNTETWYLGVEKEVLTQTIFLCPLHSDQQNWGEGGSALRTLCFSSGSDFRSPNGSRCAARHLFSKYLCTVETALAVRVGRSGSWCVERLGWGKLGSWCAEVEMNVDDDVEERSDRCLRKSGHGLREGGRSQRNDRIQRNNHRRVDDRQHSRRTVVWLDHSDYYVTGGRRGNGTPKHRGDKKNEPPPPQIAIV